MRFFYGTEGKFERFRVLEDNVDALCAEVPPFDASAVAVKRLHKQWHNTGENNEWSEFLAKLATNKTWIAGWCEDECWFNFPLIHNDSAIGAAEEMCHVTIALLKSVGGINVAGFALLLPRSKLPTHTDTTGFHYNSAALNMMLTGSKSRLCVGPEDFHEHVKGKAVIFNSEYPHCAYNDGDTNRVILYVDFRLS